MISIHQAFLTIHINGVIDVCSDCGAIPTKGQPKGEKIIMCLQAPNWLLKLVNIPNFTISIFKILYFIVEFEKNYPECILSCYENNEENKAFWTSSKWHKIPTNLSQFYLNFTRMI